MLTSKDGNRIHCSTSNIWLLYFILSCAFVTLDNSDNREWGFDRLIKAGLGWLWVRDSPWCDGGGGPHCEWEYCSSSSAALLHQEYG